MRLHLSRESLGEGDEPTDLEIDLDLGGTPARAVEVLVAEVLRRKWLPERIEQGVYGTSRFRHVWCITSRRPLFLLGTESGGDVVGSWARLHSRASFAHDLVDRGGIVRLHWFWLPSPSVDSVFPMLNRLCIETEVAVDEAAPGGERRATLCLRRQHSSSEARTQPLPWTRRFVGFGRKAPLARVRMMRNDVHPADCPAPLMVQVPMERGGDLDLSALVDEAFRERWMPAFLDCTGRRGEGRRRIGTWVGLSAAPLLLLVDAEWVPIPRVPGQQVLAREGDAVLVEWCGPTGRHPASSAHELAEVVGKFWRVPQECLDKWGASEGA